MASPTKALENVKSELLPGENVIAMVPAVRTKTPDSFSGTNRGVLVVTDRRVVFSGSGLGAQETRAIPLRQVTSVDLHKNLALAYVQVTLAGGFDRYLVKYRAAEPFAAAARQVLAGE